MSLSFVAINLYLGKPTKVSDVGLQVKPLSDSFVTIFVINYSYKLVFEG